MWARKEDREAYQHLLWAKSHARDGLMGHMRIEAKIANEFTARADELRREAEKLRRKR
ncbi:hypothetical protein ACFXJ8_25905 [Nonomuraea sp. NPDC059194]|uniref:hypothetical protein n=1 Tax=Nonomuraea sp. NPDC059194 TaxID=3346764 RepID=UPI0036BBCFAF